MSTASERAKGRRGLRLEFLEDRKLLSTLTPTPNSVAAEVARPAFAPVTTLQGTLQGQAATAGLFTPTFPNYHSYSGHGTFRPSGNVLFSVQQFEFVNAPRTQLTIANGSALLTTFRGDKLYISYTGSGPISGRKPVAVTLTGGVTGGTGRFANETGTFSAFGTVNPVTRRLSIDYSIVFVRPTRF